MIKAIIGISPFFLGPLLISAKTPLPFEFYLELQSILLALFCVWALLRRKVRKESKTLLPSFVIAKYEQRVGRKIRDGLDFLWLLTLVILSAAFMQMLRLRTSELFFGFVLFCMSLLALSDACSRRGWIRLMLPLYFLAQTALGYLSVLTYIQGWLWQPLSICVGFAGLLMSVRLIENAQAYSLIAKEPRAKIQKKGKKQKGRKKDSQEKMEKDPPLGYNKEFLFHVYRATLVLSPVVAAFPAYFKILPANYLILLVVLPLSQQHLLGLHPLGLESSHLGGLERHAKQCTLLFVILLLILRLW